MHLSCTKRNRFGFTLVELLVVVSVLATLSIVAYASAQSIQTGRYNAKRVADVTSLSSAVETQLMQNKTLPDPTANRQYYDNFGGYEHSASGAYGVTSSFSEDILGKTTVADHPKDPDTGSYYAYGKLLKYAPQYQIGAVLRVDGTPTAYIRGNYDREELKSLIKGYNTSSFTTDGATDNLPYDPYKKQVTAYVIESSGSVSVSPTKPTNSPLTSWDTVIVSTGWLALVKVSDGTELIVGSTSAETRLELRNLALKDESGLLTHVRAVLGSGEVLAKAPKLRESGSDRSDLEIETGTAVAAVRGTIFEVSAGGGGTLPSYTLIEGSIKLSANEASSPSLQVYIPWAWGDTSSQNTITVAEGQNPIRVTIPSTTDPNRTVSPNTVDSSELQRIRQKLEVTQGLEQSVIIPDNITFTGSVSANWDGSGMTGSISIDQLDETGVFVRVNGLTGSLAHGSTDVIEFPATSSDWAYRIAYCKPGISGIKCSREFKINIPNPQPWTINLSGLKPRVITDTIQKQIVANREDICDFEKDPSLFACVDYRTGNANLKWRSGVSFSSTGANYSFEEDGIRFNRGEGGNGYMKYTYSGASLSGALGNGYGIRLWIQGNNLKALTTLTQGNTIDKFYLYKDSVQLFVQNGELYIYTNSTWTKSLISPTTLNQLENSKIYEVALDVQDIKLSWSSISIEFLGVTQQVHTNEVSYPNNLPNISNNLFVWTWLSSSLLYFKVKNR